MSAPAISEQVALVTGASRGIGAAIALELAQRGFKVVGTATSEAGAANITQALSGHAGCSGRVLDVNDATSRIFVGIFAQLVHKGRTTSKGHDRPLDAPIGRLNECDSQRVLDVSCLIANFVRVP